MFEFVCFILFFIFYKIELLNIYLKQFKKKMKGAEDHLLLSPLLIPNNITNDDVFIMNLCMRDSRIREDKASRLLYRLILIVKDDPIFKLLISARDSRLILGELCRNNDIKLLIESLVTINLAECIINGFIYDRVFTTYENNASND